MNNDNKTAVRPKLKRVVSTGKTRASKEAAARRTAAREAYRAKIEALLDKSRDEQLTDVWERICPFAIDPACELPDRRGIIKDLADFAVVLRPSLYGMQAHGFCRLIEKYAASESRQPDGRLHAPSCRLQHSALN